MIRKIIIALGVLCFVLTIVTSNDYVREHIVDIHPGIFSTLTSVLVICTMQLKKDKKDSKTCQ